MFSMLKEEMMDGGKSKRLAKRQQHLGDEFKNTAEYRAMRRKNNEAAKKCRENRRIKEVDTDQKVRLHLEQSSVRFFYNLIFYQGTLRK